MTRIVLGCVLTCFVLLCCVAVYDCRKSEAEQNATYEVRYASKVRVVPGTIAYTTLDGHTYTVTVPAGSSVQCWRTLSPGAPLKIEWWQIRGRTVFNIHVPEGYPLHD